MRRGRDGRGGRGGVVEVDVGGRGGEFCPGLDQAGLEADDVVAQLVVLGLDGFVAVIQGVVLADLLFEAFDVAFFALSEGSLFAMET